MRIACACILPIVVACGKTDATSSAPTSATPDVATTAPAKASSPVKVSGKAVIGEPAPDFELTGLDGAKVKLSDHQGKVVVIEWFNPDCPYVRQAHNIGSLKGMAAKMKEQHGDIVWLAVNSGAPGKQGHGEETNRKGKESFGIGYPILFDAEGAVGQAYGATNTPHMYVIDQAGILVYAGALDNTRSGDPEDAEPELINYVADALDDVSAGKPVRKAETKAWGCSVKYAKR